MTPTGDFDWRATKIKIETPALIGGLSFFAATPKGRAENTLSKVRLWVLGGEKRRRRRQ
ncbi:hypothetical protein [Methylocystis suflitae]|uniref:hypothetical protein n=1 Tax=Methylocystis suflitae TaxID=2951405 RepID=UPI00210ED527|nr:hypothetical protein [Methylocystis suflitae]MCQ4189927.1 hypothetical protein [Methylocystis suflitae]